MTKFLRDLCVQTGATIIIVHHDVKPSAVPGWSNNRRRSQKASGGDWFAACECPISFENEGTLVSVTPEDYKHSGDPEPFTLTIDEDLQNDSVRVIGEEVAHLEVCIAADERKNEVFDFVRKNPGQSENQIAKGCHIQRQVVASVLRELEQEGKLKWELGARNAHLWSVVSAMTVSG